MAGAAAPSTTEGTQPPVIDAVAELPSEDAATVIFTGEESTVSLEAGEATADTEPAEGRRDEEARFLTFTTVSSATAVQGQENVTLTAVVSAPDGPSGLSVNAGVVTSVVHSGEGVEVGAAVTGLVSDGSATVEFPVSELAAGSYAIRATYDPGAVGGAYSRSAA